MASTTGSTPGSTPGSPAGRAPWRDKWARIIFESDTPAGKAFDVGLLVVIGVSVLAVIFESVPSIRAKWHPQLLVIEWAVTAVFFLEYLARLATAPSASRYARSWLGLVDLLALAPAPLSLLFPGSQHLLVVRAVRLLRVFRILKLATYINEAGLLILALRGSLRRILVFFAAVLVLVAILGSLMYVIEGPQNGFTSIPTAIYWSIVTLTTVGYGDISPKTDLGRFVASCVMLIGYAILAVPTGIVTSEMTRLARPRDDGKDGEARGACPSCGAVGHASDATFCRRCAARLPG